MANDLRDRLLHTATAAFRTRGFEATSVDALGATLGVSGPAMYYHFPTKTDLLFECLHAPLVEQVDQCRNAIDGKPPIEQLTAFVRAHVLYNLRELRRLDLDSSGDAVVGIGVLAKALPDAGRKTIVGLLHEHVQDLRDVIVAGVRTGDFDSPNPTASAFAILGMAENVTWLRRGGRLSPDALADLYAGFARRMVAP